MANCVMAFPNYIDSTYQGNGYDGVAFSNGSWESDMPISNVAEEYLVDFAQSTDATNASTKFDIDYGVSRDIKVVVLMGNFSRSGRGRYRLTDVPQFRGATINSSALLGASSVSFLAGPAAITVTTGDYFTIEGDSTVYKATNTVSIGSNSTGTVNITPTLAAPLSGGEEIVCRTGNFTTTVLDSGWMDIWREVYAFGTIPYGHPSFYDGKVSAEDAVGQRFPFIYIPETSGLGRYARYEIDDTDNPDGYVTIERAFSAPGWQTTINPIYGLDIGWKSNTYTERTLGGADIFETRKAEREIAFQFDMLPEDEAFSFPYEMQRLLDLNGQLIFIYDPDDTVHLQRRTILARMKTLSPLKHPLFQTISTAFELKEVIA